MRSEATPCDPHLSPAQRVGGRWLTGKGIPSANRQSPLILDQGPLAALGALIAPLGPALGAHPGHLHIHTHSHRSCQNPDILTNPRSTTLTDAAERWMQKARTPDPCQGWREQLLHAPSAPPLCKISPLRHRRALSAPLPPQTMMEENPFILKLGTGGQGALVTPHEHKLGADAQVCKHFHTQSGLCPTQREDFSANLEF